MDGTRRGKPGLAGIGGDIRNEKGEVLHLFSKHVGIQDSNEAKILAILEALHIFYSLYQQLLIVESDSSNAISWVTSFNCPLKLQIYFNEIRHLASWSQVSFQHIVGPPIVGGLSC